MKGLERVLPHPVLSMSLAAIWLVLNATLAPGHLVLAAVLGVALPLITRRYWPERPPFHRLPLLWRLFFVVNWDIVVASLMVAWLTFTRRSRDLQPRFVEIQLECRNPYSMALLVAIITITPGTVAADLDPEHRLILVHWLHEPDPERSVARIRSRYEKPLEEILG